MILRNKEYLRDGHLKNKGVSHITNLQITTNANFANLNDGDAGTGSLRLTKFLRTFLSKFRCDNRDFFDILLNHVDARLTLGRFSRLDLIREASIGDV